MEGRLGCHDVVDAIVGNLSPKGLVHGLIPRKAEFLMVDPQLDFELLERQRLQDNIYILTGCSDKLMEPRTLRNHFKKTLRACNIRAINFHALRHSFATRWIELGYDVKTLSEILGHSSVNVTLNYYVHPSIESKRQSISNFSRNVFLTSN